MKLSFGLFFTIFFTANNWLNPSQTQKPNSDNNFEIMEGFQIELVVAEPLIHDPVAMEIDEDGNWYVAEMPGYPLDLSKTGTIKKLKDTNGDGLPDTSVVFAKGLTLPMGLMKWKKGLLVADAPNVWYLEDTNGDEVADEKQAVLTGFSLSNPQHNMNSPKFGIDNWIYLGHSGAINSFAFEKVFSDKGTEIRFPNNPKAPKLAKNGDGKNVRFKPESYQLESLSGETQYGHTTDAWGHRFYTDNANHQYHEVIDARYIAKNPHLALADAMQKIPDHGDACEVFPITENPNHQLLTDVGVVTSSCSITYYDGAAFGENFDNLTFIAEPVHNLIHADIVVPNGASFTGKRLLEKKEFLASKDPWFRPVNFFVGPDGALYLVDYYRQIVEHPEWMSDEINNSGALYNGTDKGRIYRISKKGSEKMNWFGKTNLSALPSAELVKLLIHENGWYRRTAQRLLFQRNETSVAPQLGEILAGNNPKAKIPALWLLYDWGKITPQILTNLLADANPGVKENALQVTDRLFQQSEYQGNTNLRSRILATANDVDARVRFQWLCSSAFFNFDEINNKKAEILLKDIDNSWAGIAAIAASKNQETELFENITKHLGERESAGGAQFLSQLSATLAKAGNKNIFSQALKTEAWWQSAVFEGIASLWKYAKPSFKVTESDKLKLTQIFENTKSAELQKQINNLLQIVGLPQNLSFVKAVSKNIEKTENADFQTNVLKLISMTHKPEYLEKINSIILKPKNKASQLAALNALPPIISNAQISKINQKYSTFSTESKKTWILYLLDRPTTVPNLLTEISRKNIAENDLEWYQKVELMNYYDVNIRKKAREVLSLNEDRKAVLQKYLVAADRTGNPENGKKIFEENCMSCHQIKGVAGTSFGPDLSTLKSRNAHSIITEIINPNNSIADKYGSWDIQLKSGKKITGIITGENNDQIFLKVIGGTVQTISTADIKVKTVSKLSAMPNGLENAISVIQMSDIVAFIKNI